MTTLSAGARLHPWNTAFEWRDHTPPFGFLSSEQVEAFDRDGVVVVPDVLDADLVARVRAETDRYEAQTEAFLQRQEGGRASIAETGAITFTTHLVARSPLLRDLAAHPSIVGICRDLVGADVNVYWDQAVYKKPEKPRRFPWHQDNGYTFIEPQQYLTCWIALTDATLDNGCPQVARGLHRVGTLRHRYVDPLGFECLDDPDDVIAAPVAAGGIVVFSSLTPHLTGPNTTEVVRKAYILQYAPAGARIQRGDPRQGPPSMEEPCDDPARQYPVLRAGERVEPPPLAGLS